MPYWLIEYDYGYGPMADVVDAETHGEAVDIAYEAWREGAETSADYSAQAVTVQNLEENDFNPADYGLEPSE